MCIYVGYGINGCGKEGCWLQLIFLLNGTQRDSCGSMVTTSAWISELFDTRWWKAWSVRGVLCLYRHCLTLVEIVHVSAGECGWPVLPLGSRTNPLLTFQQGFLSLGLERKLPSAKGWWAICFLWGSRCAQNCCVSAWLRRCSAGHLWPGSRGGRDVCRGRCQHGVQDPVLLFQQV